MDPPLSKGAVDRHNWNTFIKFIKKHYEDDRQVEIKPNYINFKAGEHPKLHFEGHKFLRFSSKVSGSHRDCFGSRKLYQNYHTCRKSPFRFPR